MKQANIVIMGKTGTGKSTIVNAIMGSDVAPTGKGRPVTLKNDIYSKTMKFRIKIFRKITCNINLYDTVGLELDNSITNKTLNEIKCHIEKAQKDSSDSDANLVWFCVSSRLERFEQFEVDLINKLVYDYEIPFIVVMTQCFSEEKGKLEQQIEADLPEIPIMRILAQDYKVRTGKIFPAFGVNSLLKKSVFNCDKFKVRILKSKLDKLSSEVNISKEKIAKMEQQGKAIIDGYSDMAKKIGYIPAVCIPIIHGLCIEMITELNKVFEIITTEGFGTDIFSNVMLGIIATPLMVVPVLSAGAAYAYVGTVGESYINAIKNVAMHSPYADICNKELMAERIKRELQGKS